MSKKAGRPKKAQAAKRAPGVSVRLTEDEYEVVKSAIKRSGLRKSDFLRKSLLYIASNDIRIT